MIRDAVRQFNDIGTVRRMEALNEMTELFRKYQQDLSWLGGNFNQSMKRANELAIGHELRQEYYDQVILPQVRQVLSFLEDVKSEQHLIAQKLIKHNPQI
jgi:arginyl-tRNA--protein-N-Asp/Glu arginylyltransferase